MLSPTWDAARLLRCPRCRNVYDDGRRCVGCGARVHFDGVAADVVGDSSPPDSVGARVMQSRWLARLYESCWRPLTFALSTGLRMPTAEEEGALVVAKLEGARGPWLDLSCGPGQVTRRLVAVSCRRLVVAVDLSRAMLVRARANAPLALRVRADALALPFADGAFGAVVNLAALDLYPDAARAIAESARVLAPGGRWIASTFVAPDAPAGRPRQRGRWARAAGLRTPTESTLRSSAARAGLVRLASVRFGSYVVAWADKGEEP